MVTQVPYANGGGADIRAFSAEGHTPRIAAKQTARSVQTVSRTIFVLMQIALDEGRQLANTDGDGTLPVAVISKSLARRYFPRRKAPGEKAESRASRRRVPWLTIVGIVDDVHYSWINKDDIPTIYRTYRQAPPLYASWSCAPAEIRAHSSLMFAAK